MGRRPPAGFNTPFARLALQVESGRVETGPAPPKVGGIEREDDTELFTRTVGAVRPLDERASHRPRPDPPDEAAPDPNPDENAEALAVLSDLVAGVGPLDVMDTDEWVEGIATGVDRRLLDGLRQGLYSVQAHVDLHGLVRDIARKEVHRFIADARVRRYRCVLIVHGRGLNSPGGEPVLKRVLVRWLSRGALGKEVLAFSTARRHDGGAGALYVLLRR